MIRIKKLLVANRGEIALRIMRSAKEMHIRTIAVFSEADRASPHVKYADEAVCIGAAPSSQSYLNGKKIIETALLLQADAIHPGYGFLSENAGFAQLVLEAGLVFVGPSPASITTMGSKLAAKASASRFNIPMVPGGDMAITEVNEAKKIAASIGYPVLIKASAGGGGKGMRIVESEDVFEEQMHRAVSEAAASFGDGSVFIEKYISSPRHIEIQVLGDQHGNIVHLFERECSIQRRYQKVIEEAPSSVLTPEVRASMGKDAVAVARSCGYYSAGTVEFIMDQDLNYYFLEMNTRLQVEHPVTEMITGLDLVKQQIHIAQGEQLLFKQADLKLAGHAIELRVYAEDPASGFLPDTGVLITYQTPKGPGIRVDDGFEQGMEIPIYYDPMIAKLIAYGADRQEAIQKMIRAIEEYKITGVENTLAFGKYVMQHEAFTSGNFDTHFVAKFCQGDYLNNNTVSQDIETIAAALSFKIFENAKSVSSTYEMLPSEWRKNRK